MIVRILDSLRYMASENESLYHVSNLFSTLRSKPGPTTTAYEVLSDRP